MMAAFDFDRWMTTQLAAIEPALEQSVSPQAWTQQSCPAPDSLLAAMRYAVLGGGKRLRPLLVLAAFEAVQSGASAAAARRLALRAACAVELIHAYSLAHDDLPCMDNDVLRRGKPALYVKFGQASALLAGDALQALAFELLVPEDGAQLAGVQAQLCRLLARAAGCAGMAGGQAIDLASVGRQLSEAQLRQMHRLKTGALLQASVMMGAACAGVVEPARTALETFSAALGLAFQVVDDVLDVTADSATLGKTAGKDAGCDKPTYVSLLGLPAAQALAQELVEQALQALACEQLTDVRALQALATMVTGRGH